MPKRRKHSYKGTKYEAFIELGVKKHKHVERSYALQKAAHALSDGPKRRRLLKLAQLHADKAYVAGREMLKQPADVLRNFGVR